MRSVHAVKHPWARSFRAACWAGGAVLWAACSAAADDPRVWVDRMNQALATRNYDGVLVHQLGDRQDTLRIIHRIQDGRLTERLLSADGSGREFVRSDDELVSYFPERRIVVVERRSRSLGFIGGLPGVDANSYSQYDLGDAEPALVQGRPTRLVSIRPRDIYRYGYRLWIDEKTSMPVQTQLFAGDGTIIEQNTFASLSLPTTIDEQLLRTQLPTEGYRWLRRQPPQFKPGEMLPWMAQTLPPGFRRTGLNGADAVNKPAGHLLFSDGLVTVSVFIESAETPPALTRNGTPRKANGAAQLGAAAAYTAHIEGYRVTAVGEVPPLTVRLIAESLRPLRDPAAGNTAAAGR